MMIVQFEIDDSVVEKVKKHLAYKVVAPSKLGDLEIAVLKCKLETTVMDEHLIPESDVMQFHLAALAISQRLIEEGGEE